MTLLVIIAVTVALTTILANIMGELALRRRATHSPPADPRRDVQAGWDKAGEQVDATVYRFPDRT